MADAWDQFPDAPAPARTPATPPVRAGTSAPNPWDAFPDAPSQPRRQPSVWGDLNREHDDHSMALRQGVSPWSSSPELMSTPPRRLGNVQEFEWGQGYKGPNGEDLFINPKTDFVARDPATGQLAVYARNAATNESPFTTATRDVLGGMVTGPVAGIQRAASAPRAGTALARPAATTVGTETGAAMAATRATEAGRDLEAFNRLDVRPFGPAFNQGPVASVAKQLTETPLIGAPLRNALDESLTGAGAATRNIAQSMAPAASIEQTGLALQRALDRYRTAGVSSIEPGVLEAALARANNTTRSSAWAPVQRASEMGAATAQRAGQAAQIRTAAHETPTAFTSRGVPVPAARPLNETILARRGVGDMSTAEREALIRAPSSETSFATRQEALYEHAWNRIPATFKVNDARNPGLMRATNTSNEFQRIAENERRAGISGGVAQGRFGQMAERVRTNTTLESLRQMRTEIGRALSNFGVYDTGLDRSQLKQISGSLSRDIEIGVQDLANRARIQASRTGDANMLQQAQQATGALYDLRRADRYTRLGMERMDSFAKLVGNENPQQMIGVLIRASLDGTKGNIRMLRTAMAALRPEERQQLSSLVLLELGKPVGSARGVTEEIGFSVASFMTRWNNMAPEARGILFGGEHARAINDLERVARRLANVEALANTSRSGTNTLNLSALLGSGAIAGSSAATGQFMASIGTLLGTAISGSAAALILSRPSYVQWLNGYAKVRAATLAAPLNTSSARLTTHVNLLGQMAGREPLLLPVYRAVASENGVGQDGQKQQPVNQGAR